MSDLLEGAIVRILCGDQPVGVGFLVGQRAVLTCRHVIEAALDEKEVAAGAQVAIDFPLLAEGERRTATVDFVSPGVDVAGLTVTPPEQARAVRLVDVEEITGHQVHMFGFSAGRPQGVWSVGTVLGRTADGRVQIEDTRSHGITMSRGFSGGPLVDRRLGAVIGMIAEVENRAERRTGYALSGRLLHETWPTLGEPHAQSSPFRGLETFTEADAPRFFGRREQAKNAMRRLDTEGALIITGPSGSGKSSLALAGVVPRLREPDAEVIVFRPAVSTNPWLALATVLIDHLNTDGTLAQVTELADRLRAGDMENVLYRVLVRGHLSRLVIVVDQLDEGLVRSPAETEAILTVLLNQAEALRRRPKIDLLMTASSEHLGRLLAHPALGARLQDRILTLATPGPDELREMIERPLEAVGMPVFQDGLVEVILEDVREERNPLPLVEFTLALLWDHQERGALTHRAYREIGGVAGAISHYAEEIWDVLAGDENAERLFRWLFCQLISPLPDGTFVRRIVAVADLEVLGPAITSLAATRLITLAEDAAGEPTVEFAHEALVRHWERLRDWLEEQREFRLFQDEIDTQARRWHQQRKRSLLLRGGVLRRARSLLRADAASLTFRQRVFIRASIRGAMRRWFFRVFVGELVVGLALSISLVIYVVRTVSVDQKAQKAAATLLEKADEHATDRAQGELEQALLALRAFRTVHNEHTASALRQWYRNLRYAKLLLPTPYGGGGLNPAGDLAVAGTDEDGLEIYDLKASPVTSASIRVDRSDAFAFAWVGSDRLAVSGGGRIEIWDAREVTLLGTIQGSADKLVASISGHWLGWGRTGERRFHVTDLRTARRVDRVVSLPGALAPPRQGPPDAVNVGHVFDDGDVLISQREKRRIVSRRGSRPWSRQWTAKVMTDSKGRESVLECMKDSGFVLRVPRTGKITARYADKRVRCDLIADGFETHAAFTDDGRHVALLDFGGEAVWERHSYLDIGPVNGLRRRFPCPLGYWPEHLSVAPSGNYRLVLSSTKSLLVLEIPVADGLDAAIAASDDRVMIGGGRYLMTYLGRRLEVWEPSTRRLTGAADDVDVWTSSLDGRHVVTADRSGKVVIRRPSDLLPVAETRLPVRGNKWSLVSDGTRLVTEQENVLNVWSHSGERLSADIDLGPVDHDRGRDVLIRPGRPEIIVIEGSAVRRYSFAAGRPIADSEFSMGGENIEHWTSIKPDVDPGGSLILVYREDGVETWDLESHTRVARLPISLIPRSSVAIRAALVSEHEVRIELDAQYHEPATAVMVWDRNRFLRIPDILGRPDLQLRRSHTAVLPGSWELAWMFASVEPADTSTWTRRICEIVHDSRHSDIYFGFADGAYAGKVC